MLREETMRTVRTVRGNKGTITIALLLIMALALPGCTGSNTNATSKPSEESPEIVGNGMTAKELKDYWKEQDMLDSYEHQYQDWMFAEGVLKEWLNSGEQYPECREAILEWASEIADFPMSDVPDSYKSTHDQLLSRALELRGQVGFAGGSNG
jgi:hypothetical protein